jgi:hypothetical protein
LQAGFLFLDNPSKKFITDCFGSRVIEFQQLLGLPIGIKRLLLGSIVSNSLLMPAQARWTV